MYESNDRQFRADVESTSDAVILSDEGMRRTRIIRTTKTRLTTSDGTQWMRSTGRRVGDGGSVSRMFSQWSRDPELVALTETRANIMHRDAVISLLRKAAKKIEQTARTHGSSVPIDVLESAEMQARGIDRTLSEALPYE